MPLGFERHHPGGMTENSPAFQRRDKGAEASSPEGTIEMACFSRPFGTYILRTLNPALKRWAIFTCPFGTQTAFVTSIPSGIGRLVPTSAGKLAGGVRTCSQVGGIRVDEAVPALVHGKPPRPYAAHRDHEPLQPDVSRL